MGGRQFYEFPLKPLEPWILGIETQREVNELSPGSAPTVRPPWACVRCHLPEPASELSPTCHLLAASLEGKAVCRSVCVCVCLHCLLRGLCPGHTAPALHLGLASCTEAVFEPLVFVYPSASAVRE